MKKIDEFIIKCAKLMFGVKISVIFVDGDKDIIFEEESPIIQNPVITNVSKSKQDVRVKFSDVPSEKPVNILIGKLILNNEFDSIKKINLSYGATIIAGEVCSFEFRKLRSGKYILMLDVWDTTSSITCKAFLTSAYFDVLNEKIKIGMNVKVEGRVTNDMYSNELTILIDNLNINTSVEKKERIDEAENKRVELHLHTQMSAMDGVSSASDLVKQAIKFGHKAVAITDHGTVQAFPEAHMAITKAFSKQIKESGFKDLPTKVLYGVEAYLVADLDRKKEECNTYCVFDLETTGFKAGIDKITEVAVCKVRDGKIIDEFQTFVNPERPIPKEVQELTHITNEMVEDAPIIDTVIQDFKEFTKDSILVAHNSAFDLSFITYYLKDISNLAIDSLAISRELYEYYENHKLGTIATNMNISNEGAHRAINDVRMLVQILNQMEKDLAKKNMKLTDYAYTVLDKSYRDLKVYHATIIAKNYTGLKNLYKLISFSNLHTFYKKPRISKSMIERYREGLIIGSACEQGEVYQAIYNNVENVERIAKFYDYLEIQPLKNNEFYIRENKVKSFDDLIDINKKIVGLGNKLNKMVVAASDVHYLNKEDEVYRRIIMAGQGFEDADNQPDLYFRNTNEMLDEFSYLDEETRNRVVIENPNKIADMCELIQPVPDGTFPPSIEGSDEEIERLSYQRAREIYGDNLPEIVESRLEKELKPIIKYGFAVMYMIARKLVLKSNADGYLVGSRGSVGSSFVATMVGITEINPLPPHYVCKKCKHSEFPETNVTTGIDMDNKSCPNCNIEMEKNGIDIPFETFLGFKGDKAPDIDLNFSGDYQSKAHDYTEKLFGKSKTFRAGTISTVADKTAYGFVKNYFESKNENIFNAEINRLSKKCTGIKRTTGQHPGGIIVVPADKDIYDFTPIQKPADDMFSKSITTHFDFHSIHDNLLKLDILGHDDPTVIRMLEDLTGIDAKTIKLDEPKVMSLFSSTEILGVTKEQINSEVGTYAVPEFGTKFVRQMLVDTKPTTFGELVRISGLSHGTDVWLNNAQTLIQNNITTLKDSICTRDDIMIYLIKMELEPSIAFKIMESVRKGKGLTEEMEAAMKEKDVPEWYIESCKKIKYMFPKAHAAAYVTMAYRIAYFKVYYPKEFYATYLTIRTSNFLSEIMLEGKTVVKDAIKKYEEIQRPSQTEKDILTVLEVVNEMLERNVKFLKVDIYKSDSKKFLVEEDGVRPPLSALTGFGEVDANKLVTARKEGPFETVEDLTFRCKLGKVAIEILDKNGCLDNMPKSNQISFF